MEKAQHKNKKGPRCPSLRANDCASRFRSRPQWISLARSPEQPLRSFTSYSASSRQSRRFADPWLRAGWPASRRKEKRRRPLIARLLNKDHARHASLSFRSKISRRSTHLVGAEARTACVWINDPAMLATEGPKHRRVRSAPPDQLRRCKTVARYASAPRVGAPPQASGLSRL